MAEQTAIEWCDSTFNPWVGCTRVSPGCDHCYAAVSTPARSMAIQWGPGQLRHRTAESTWQQPMRWEREHEAFHQQHGRRRRVFCASLADVFDNEVPDEWRADLFWLIHQTPHLDWLLLTKRIGNAARMLHGVRITLDPMAEWPEVLPNIWLGATVVNQEEAERDIPKLLATPASVRFLSVEPMLGPIDLRKGASGRLWMGGQRGCGAMHHGIGTPDCPREPHHHHDERCGPGIDWVICGGESGPKARPMHPDWAISLRDQCAAAGVPFLFKQWGEWRKPLSGEPFDTTMGRAQRVPAFIVAPTGTVHCFENDQTASGGKAMVRVGKKTAGRLLDGVEHNGFPEVR
jgi:protein gp37